MNKFVQFVVLGAVLLTAVSVFAEVPEKQSVVSAAFVQTGGVVPN
ncbi:MAG: hypothetical protein ABJ360_06770 [Roseobacter sp.]